MHFTFGPRHRIVTTAPRLSWVRVLLTIILFAALGAMFSVALFAPTTAHAGTLDDVQLRRAAEGFNDRCRGGSGDAVETRAACLLRDKVLQSLEKRGQCWNSKAETPAKLWVSCGEPQVLQANACIREGEIAYAVAMMRDGGVAPKTAYARAQDMADGWGLTRVNAEALVWSAYAERGGWRPSAIRHDVIYNCRRALGQL